MPVKSPGFRWEQVPSPARLCLPKALFYAAFRIPGWHMPLLPASADLVAPWPGFFAAFRVLLHLDMCGCSFPPRPYRCRSRPLHCESLPFSDRGLSAGARPLYLTALVQREIAFLELGR
jgi:hypothetical protein